MSIDTHADTPLNFLDPDFDIGKWNDFEETRSRVDFSRMKAGKLDAVFMAVFIGQGELIILAIKTSFRKIGVFLFAILNIVVIIGAIMYVVEGEANGFDSIPRSIYWTIVTITTVGYGDISPQTPLGQFISSIIMIVGYSIIAIPTGIVSAEIAKQNYKKDKPKCKSCGTDINSKDRFCPNCGIKQE